MSGVTIGALAATGIVTYDEIKNRHHTMPCPARYLYVFALFGLIGLVPEPLSVALAAAAVIALLVAGKSKAVAQITRAQTTGAATGAAAGATQGGAQ